METPDLGHQRAYLRKTLREVYNLTTDLLYSKSRVDKIEREIREKINNAFSYTEHLPAEQPESNQ